MPGRIRRLLLAAVAAPALAGCASIAENVGEAVNDTVGDALVATLGGAAMVPPGDPDGSGSARVTVNDVTNEICTALYVRDIGEVTAAHIHRGGAGVSGPPVITLAGPDSANCDTHGNALVDEIRHNPGGFYLNLHTAAYPNGALRGQLRHAAN